MNRRKLAIVGGAIAVACVVVSVFAMMMAQRQLSTGGEIIGVSIDLLQDDGVTPWTTIDWGSLYAKGQGIPWNKTFVGFVNNTNNYEVECTVTTNNLVPSNIWSWATFTENATDMIVAEYSMEPFYVNFAAGMMAPQGDSFSFTIIVSANTTLTE